MTTYSIDIWTDDKILGDSFLGVSTIGDKRKRIVTIHSKMGGDIVYHDIKDIPENKGNFKLAASVYLSANTLVELTEAVRDFMINATE